MQTSSFTMPPGSAASFSRIPRHVGFIPDGNRRWAVAHGLARRDGYAAGIPPGLQLLELCGRLGVEEVSIYGFTKDNVHRAPEQVEAFRRSCVEFAERALQAGAALLVVGDDSTEVFPAALRPYVHDRSAGGLRVNLLVNYGWQWDLGRALMSPGANAPRSSAALMQAVASRQVSRIDLVVRWGGRRRLSGFLPLQCAYADIYVVDSLWPDMRLDEFTEALRWYEQQDVTLGG